jgi:drug/metabolite transporter (DMT)-like permease
LSTSAWAAIVFIGLSSGGGYVLWLWALANIAATRVTVFLSLSPVTAAVLGVTLLGEPVTLGMMAGVTCVAAGLWVANREGERRAAEELPCNHSCHDDAKVR